MEWLTRLNHQLIGFDTSPPIYFIKQHPIQNTLKRGNEPDFNYFYLSILRRSNRVNPIVIVDNAEGVAFSPFSSISFTLLPLLRRMEKVRTRG